MRLLCPWCSPGKNTGVGCHTLLQGIFLTQGSNPHLSLLYCMWILYSLSHLWSSCLSLLLLGRLSHVRLCATPQTAAHQAPLSLGFSRQEHWSGLPFPSPMCESEVAQSCPTPSDPMDCSLPGSSIHGICQARVLEWGAIAFCMSISRKAINFCIPVLWVYMLISLINSNFSVESLKLCM